MDPKVSVLLSFYNSQDYLADAIQSILGQTLTDFELILINDASTDDSVNVAKKFTDTRITIIENIENLGLTRSLNIGLAKAKGKYIARLDADDIAEPVRLEKQVRYMEDHPDIFVLGSSLQIKETGEVWQAVVGPEEVKVQLLFNNPVFHPTAMIRDFKGLRYDEIFRYAQDYALWAELVLRGKHLANLSDILVARRNLPTAISAVKKDDQQVCADKTRLRILQALGLYPTGMELEIHREISLETYSNSSYTFDDKDKWMNSIVKANMEKALFNKNLLYRNLKVRWMKFFELETNKEKRIFNSQFLRFTDKIRLFIDHL